MRFWPSKLSIAAGAVSLSSPFPTRAWYDPVAPPSLPCGLLDAITVIFTALSLPGGLPDRTDSAGR